MSEVWSGLALCRTFSNLPWIVEPSYGSGGGRMGAMLAVCLSSRCSRTAPGMPSVVRSPPGSGRVATGPPGGQVAGRAQAGEAA